MTFPPPASEHLSIVALIAVCISFGVDAVVMPVAVMSNSASANVGATILASMALYLASSHVWAIMVKGKTRAEKNKKVSLFIYFVDFLSLDIIMI